MTLLPAALVLCQSSTALLLQTLPSVQITLSHPIIFSPFARTFASGSCSNTCLTIVSNAALIPMLSFADVANLMVHIAHQRQHLPTHTRRPARDKRTHQARKLCCLMNSSILALSTLSFARSHLFANKQQGNCNKIDVLVNLDLTTRVSQVVRALTISSPNPLSISVQRQTSLLS
jgi:hypothetical protein